MVLFRSSEERSYKVKKVGFGKITFDMKRVFSYPNFENSLLHKSANVLCVSSMLTCLLPQG